MRILADIAVLVVVAVAAFVPREYGGLREPSAISIVLIAIGGGAVLFRRQGPRIVAYSTVLVTVCDFLVQGALAASLVTVIVGMFAVGDRTSRRSTCVAALVAMVVIVATSRIVLGPVTTDLRAVLQIVALIGFAAAAGDASRSRRAYIGEITERARQAEETKEAEARRRVADERVAIARDLHDLVAHQIAVVSLNTGVAMRAVRERPDDAERALGIIYDSAQTVLSEISGLLTVLRGGEVSAESAQLAPTPGLADLPKLIAEFESGGLTVHQRTEGSPRELPDNISAVAYRALQEALTNALKHSGAEGTRTASALVHLEYRADAIVLTVTNSTTVARPGVIVPTRRGHGLNGVRERVASVRGRIEAGQGRGPVYRFTAWLPTLGSSEREAEVRATTLSSGAVPDSAELSAPGRTAKKSVS